MIRKATKEDIPIIMPLAKAMHEEGDYADVDFNENMCSTFFEIILDDDDYCVFLALKDEKIIGGIMGCVSTFYFSLEQKANDIAVFVSEDERKSRTGLQLIKKYEEWAISKGVKRIYLGVSTGHNKVGEFYERIGYNRVGGLYRKKTEI